ncbi:MAG: hypothetical protein V1913_15550 [Fibrobacterota bacterium]
MQQHVESIFAGLPERIRVEMLEPAFTEPEVLQRVEKITGMNSDLLLCVAIHGASARALTLAVVKSQLPAVLWCHDQAHSLASSALASEALRQLCHPHILLHGKVEKVTRELGVAAYAAAAKHRLSTARIGQLGLTHFNLISAAVNPLLLQARFGTWVVPLALEAFRSARKHIDPARIVKRVADIHSAYDVDVEQGLLEQVAGVQLAIEELGDFHRLDAIAVNCWNEIVPDTGVSPCLGFAGGSYRVVCESDLAAAVTMLAGEALCGNPGYVGDFCSFDEETGTAKLLHCAGYSDLHAGCQRMKIVRQVCPAGQKGSVVACRPILPEGPAVCVQLHGKELDLLHLRRCQILRTEFPEQMQVDVQIEGDKGGFIREAAGNHYVIFPGDTENAWRTWAQWSMIQVH